MEVIGSSETTMASAIKKLRAFRLMHDFRSKRFDRLLGWTLFKKEKLQERRSQSLGQEANSMRRAELASRKKTGKRARKDLREEARSPKRVKASGGAKSEVGKKVREAEKRATPEKAIQEILKAAGQSGRTEKREHSDSGRRSTSGKAVVAQVKSTQAEKSGAEKDTEKKQRNTPEAVRSATTMSTSLQDQAHSIEKDTTVRDLEEIFSALGIGTQATETVKEDAATPMNAAATKIGKPSLGAESLRQGRSRVSNGVDKRPSKVRDFAQGSAEPGKAPPELDNQKLAAESAPKQRKDAPPEVADDEFEEAQIAPDVEAALRYLGTTFGDPPAETVSRKRRRKLRHLYVWRRFCQSWALWPSRNWYANFTTKLAERFEAIEAQKSGKSEGVLGGIDRWRVDQLRKHGRDHLADAALGKKFDGRREGAAMFEATKVEEQKRGKGAKGKRSEKGSSGEQLRTADGGAVQMQQGGGTEGKPEPEVSQEAAKESAEESHVQEEWEGERTNGEASSGQAQDLHKVRKHLACNSAETFGDVRETGILEPAPSEVKNKPSEAKSSRGARNESPGKGGRPAESRGMIADLMRVGAAVRSFPPAVEEALDQLGRMTLKTSRPLQPASIRPLSPEESARVSAAFQRFLTRDIADEPVATLGPHVVSAKELKVLNGTSWLDDQVINFYLEMIQRRNAAHRSSGRAVPKVHVFNSFFYTKLVNGGYNYAGVRRWTKKVDVFEQDVIIAPINLNNSHWALVSVNMKGRCVEFYDSLSGPVENGRAQLILQTILRYLEDESQDKKQRPLDHREQWTVKQMLQGVPQQGDGGSCGVFMCAYTDLLAQGARPPFAFSQANIPTMRRAMAAGILAGTLKGT